MTGENNSQLELLDVLTIISFVLQLKNQGNIINIQDIQEDNERAVSILQEHLKKQDEKIDRILEMIKRNEDNKRT